jgi:hypothetical protein
VKTALLCPAHTVETGMSFIMLTCSMLILVWALLDDGRILIRVLTLARRAQLQPKKPMLFRDAQPRKCVNLLSPQILNIELNGPVQTPKYSLR